MPQYITYAVVKRYVRQEENGQQIIHGFIKPKMLLKYIYISTDNAAVLEQMSLSNLAQIVTQATFGRCPV
jgi:hypothetical protein